jgi:hypothetical protein
MSEAAENVVEEKFPGGRARMTVYKKSEGHDLCKMDMVGMDESVMQGLSKLMAAQVPRDGFGDTKMLFSNPKMSLCWAWFKSGYVLPRHSHNADCLYYVLGGSLRLGSVWLKAGDGFFVPSDHGYTYDVGPEGVEVLEFRSAPEGFNFVFKGNDEAHWDKIAKAHFDNKDAWVDEKAPYSPELA